MMNKTLTRIFCLFLAFQVLFANTGFAGYKHFCKIKGVTLFHLSALKKLSCSVNKGINFEEKHSFLKRAKCCSDQTTYHKISPNASQGHKIDFKIPFPAYLRTLCDTFTYIQVSERKSLNTFLYSNSSPPLSGRDRIIFVQSLLI